MNEPAVGELVETSTSSPVLQHLNKGQHATSNLIFHFLDVLLTPLLLQIKYSNWHIVYTQLLDADYSLMGW